MRTLITTLCISCGLLAVPAHAQDLEAGIAFPGHKGVFIRLGEHVPVEGGRVSGYRIERRARVEDEYKTLAELKAIGSAKDITKGLELAVKAVPYPVEALRLPADSLWQRVKLGERMHLGAWANDIPVLLATHLAWHDADAKSGERYQYRITPSVGASRVSQWTTAGEPVTLQPVTPVSSLYYERLDQMELHYHCIGMPRPTAFRVMRSDDGAAFEEVAPIVQARQHGDTLQYLFVDTTAQRYRPYRYALKGWDLFGHAAPNMDTLYTASLDATQMPMPTDVSAAGDSTGRSIGIRWRLPNAPLVKQLTLYRSTNSEDGFEPIAALPSDRTEFIDERVRPATSYFYYFQLEYKATHIPMRAPMFAASVYDPAPPGAPEELEISSADGKVTLAWTYVSPNAHGFLVFRGENKEALKQVSTLVEGRPMPDRYQWTDDGTGLRSGYTYRYALRTVSSSHVHGALSDTVAIVPALPPTAPPTPLELEVLVDGNSLLVSWEDLSNEPFLLGYQLLRTQKPGSGMPVTDTLFLTVNHYMDTVQLPGTEHSYRVRSLSQLGPRSAFSSEATGAGRFAAVPPPSGINARRSGAIVEVTWSAALGEDITRYEVRRLVRGVEPLNIGMVRAGEALRLGDAKAPGGLCFYQVRSVAADGRMSAWSDEAGVR